MELYPEDEKRKLFKAIHEELIKPFPEGTVELKNNNAKSAYIPVQAYINRVNEVAGHLAKWRLTTAEAINHPKEKLLEMRGVLQILDTEYEGIGFADYDINASTGGISYKGEIIRTAISHAFVDACNKFQIGWIDLNRDWASNVGVGVVQRLEEGKSLPTNEPSVKCIMPNCTNNIDRKLLEKMNWKIHHCPDHIPDYHKKKYSHLL